MNTIKYISLIILCLSVNLNILQGQNDIRKEIEVVKPYVPIVSDASKINSMPLFNDTVIIKPSFDYKIVPSNIYTEYQLNKINPAKMVGMPLAKLYKSYLKLGLGNYGTPLAEVYINSMRSKKYSAGIFLHHQSSGSKLKLENGEKVFAGYSDNEATVFGKRFFKKSLLYGEAGITGNTVYHYGYRSDTVLNLEKGDIRQNYFTAAVKTGIMSSHNDSSDLSYHFNIGYKHVQNRFKQGQGDFRISAEGSKLHKKSVVGLQTSLLILKPNNNLDSMGYSNTIFNLHPFFVNTTPEYRLKVGLDINFENQADKLSFRIYPDAEISINISKDVLQGFIGITGQIKEHSYYSIAAENPFIRPDLTVKNTYLSNSIYGGVKGSLGSRASYIAKVDFSRTKNDYFFVNDTSVLAQNQFTVVYDNTQRTNVYFETNYDVSKSLAFALSASYSTYELDREAKAWNRPDLEIMFSTRYNIRNKIMANVDIISVSKRYAKAYENLFDKKELPGVVDINLGLEYRYTKILSAWLKLNNITASKYYMWNYYPAQRFNLMLGITYSL